MKILFKGLRFLASYIISGVAIYLSGYGNLVENIAPPKGEITFLLFSLIIAVIVTLIWEMYLKIARLTKRIDEIEQAQSNNS